MACRAHRGAVAARCVSAIKLAQVILPSRLALLVTTRWFIVAIFAVIAALDVALVLGVGVALFRVGALDAVMPVHMHSLSGRRQAPDTLSVGRWYDIGLTPANEAAHPVAVRLIDHHPAMVDTRDSPLLVTLPAHGWARVQYGLRSMSRGDFRFDRKEIRLHAR